MLVEQAGCALLAVTICSLEVLCLQRSLEMGSILAFSSVCVLLEKKTRLCDMQKIRLGHSLLCVSLQLPRTLHCSVSWTLNVFYLSCLRSASAGELCF